MNQKEAYEETKFSQEEELSMEEILASIRRIVNDEPGQDTLQATAVDVLELTHLIDEDESKELEVLDNPPSPSYKPHLPDAQTLRQTEKVSSLLRPEEQVVAPEEEASLSQAESVLEEQALYLAPVQGAVDTDSTSEDSLRSAPIVTIPVPSSIEAYAIDTSLIAPLSQANGEKDASLQDTDSSVTETVSSERTSSLYTSGASVFLQEDYGVEHHLKIEGLSSPDENFPAEELAPTLPEDQVADPTHHEEAPQCAYPTTPSPETQSLDISSHLSQETSTRVLEAFRTLSQQSHQMEAQSAQKVSSSGLSVEDLVRQSLQPQLDAWIQDNVPKLMTQMMSSWMEAHLTDLVNKAVEAEIRKITKGL